MFEDKIILRSVYKVTRCWMEPAIDPATGRFTSSVRRVNSQGDMILSDIDRASGDFYIAENEAIEIFDGKEFDLQDPYQAAWWEAIKCSKKIAQDRAERNAKGELIVDGNAKRYGTAEFFVERPGVEAKAKNSRKREAFEATSFIYSDAPEDLYSKVRLLGNPMPGMPLSDVEDYLVKIAEKNPQLIIELYTGTDTKLRLFLLDAIDKKVIYNKDRLYYYGEGIVLGATESAVLAFFKNPENKRIVDLMKDEVYPELALSKSEERATAARTAVKK